MNSKPSSNAARGSACRVLGLSLLLLLPACEKKAADDADSGSRKPIGKHSRHDRAPLRRTEPPASGTGVAPPEEISFSRYDADPASALAWANGQSDGKERTAALEAIAWRAAVDDLPLAVEALEAMPEGEPRNRLASHLTAEWATRDQDSALVWAMSRSEENERNEALYGWIIATGEHDPARAGTMAADEITPGAAQNRAVISVVQRWTPKDLAAATAWVESFPEGDLKNDAMDALRAVRE